VNALLNYGYAVLLSTVLQKRFAVGLDPTWGLSHAPRERATPPAYDLMVPFARVWTGGCGNGRASIPTRSSGR
jgi:CRISPR/Cas system-associated endonuclease Cas1